MDDMEYDKVELILKRLNEGDESARGELFEELESTLRRRAEFIFRTQPPWHTLQPTALIGDVYLKLSRWRNEHWNDRNHFLATAAKAMRQVLNGYSRKRKRRPPTVSMSDFEPFLVMMNGQAVDPGEISDLLDEFSEIDPITARAIELRFYGGLTMAEIAEVIGMPLSTLEKHYKAGWARLVARLK